MSLYEVKSSTKVKTDAAHNQFKGACFQLVCAVEAETAAEMVDGEYRKTW